jgi:hypothetical protein
MVSTGISIPDYESKVREISMQTVYLNQFREIVAIKLVDYIAKLEAFFQ